MEDKKSIKKLVTHDGSFHADDIFAAATLSIYLQKLSETFEIIRSRDDKIIKSADYVFDVGGIYDEATSRFDHHQVGGAGKHDSGIEYASFGLVWKKFGKEICADQKVVNLIDKKLVAPIDAGDNGINLFELKSEVAPYLIQNAFNSFNPGWKDANEETMRSSFLECIEIAKRILNNEVIKAQDIIEAEAIIASIYQDTEDKRIIVLDKKYPWWEQMQNYPEPIFVIFPRVDGKWSVEGVSAAKFSMIKRKNFPIAWAGLRDEELVNVTGVSDAVFCHRALFLTVAKSRDGAIKLAQIALES